MGSKFSLGLSDLGFSGIKSSEFTTVSNYRPRLKLINKSVPDIKRLTLSIDKAMVRAILELSDNIQRNLALAITSSIWRTNSGISDIYLSGNLLESGSISASTNGISISYDVPYAALIHYGGYITPYGNSRATKVYIPPRPWIQAVLNGTNGLPEIDYGQIIYSALREAANQ